MPVGSARTWAEESLDSNQTVFVRPEKTGRQPAPYRFREWPPTPTWRPALDAGDIVNRGPLPIGDFLRLDRRRPKEGERLSAAAARTCEFESSSASVRRATATGFLPGAGIPQDGHNAFPQFPIVSIGQKLREAGGGSPVVRLDFEDGLGEPQQDLFLALCGQEFSQDGEGRAPVRTGRRNADRAQDPMLRLGTGKQFEALQHCFGVDLPELGRRQRCGQVEREGGFCTGSRSGAADGCRSTGGAIAIGLGVHFGSAFSAAGAAAG